jgi:hypothetical protein
VERALDAVADDLAAVSDVRAEVPAVRGQHMKFARFVAVRDEVFTEVAEGTDLAL